MFYTAEDWTGLFKSQEKVDAKTLEERQNLCVFVTSLKGIKEYRGKEAEEIKKLYLSDSVVSHSKDEELKGIPVSRGKIKGTVRILLSARNADAMQKGEILVTTMTSPDFIVAMRKASAVVTDVGGLMSHAAIVSR